MEAMQARLANWTIKINATEVTSASFGIFENVFKKA